MQIEMTMQHYVRCETCGHHYEARIERCPRCQSNQNAALPAIVEDLLAMNQLAGIANSSDRKSEPHVSRKAT